MQSFLPPDKQFLITRNVPCHKRCMDIEYVGTKEEKIVEQDADGGWVDTHPFEQQLTEQIQEMTLSSNNVQSNLRSNSLVANSSSNNDEDNQQSNDALNQASDDDDDCEAADMEEFVEKGLVDDDDAVIEQPNKSTLTGNSNDEATGDGTTGVLATRTYDLNITYDNYYRTPRLWLSGYDEKQKPLEIQEMYQDISQDHAKKTVTMTDHPHIPGPPMANVHPCRHAEVMKKIIEIVEEDGKRVLEVHLYLIIFLKFVQAVIPTIEYDYTRNFTL